MRRPPLHAWTVSPREAIALQRDLADKVIRRDDFGSLRTVAGVDVAYGRRTGPARAAVVVLSFPGLAPFAEITATRPADFPYVPGLLTFREAPAAIAALNDLAMPPDLLMCDGQGLAHPRRFGLASHLGVFLDVPSVGVAKSRLIGDYDEPGPEPGAWTPLSDRGEIIGAVVRTRRGAKPLFVSIGHRIGLASAIDLILACTRGYRLPEPTRRADRLSKIHP